MDLFARALDLTVLILMFLPETVFYAFVFGVGAYVWYLVRQWCQQGRGPWRERLILPALFVLYWFMVTYTIHTRVIQRWEGAPDALPWLLLALGILVYLTNLRRPRFWALFYGASELVYTLMERFGHRLVVGREVLLSTNTWAATLLFVVMTGAAAGILAFAVHFVVGLFLRLWEKNSFFWAGSVGVFICLALLGGLWYQAPALSAAGWAPYVVPAECLLVLVGFASGYAAAAEYCFVPDMGPAPGTGLARGSRSEASRVMPAGDVRPEPVELQRGVRTAVAKLQSHGYVFVSGLRVMGDREVRIDHLLVGPNGFWMVEPVHGDRSGHGKVRPGSRWPGFHRSGAAGSGDGKDADDPVRDLKVFLRRYIGTLADEISYHHLACRQQEEGLAWSVGNGEFQVLTPEEVRETVVRAPGRNPLPQETWQRIMLLLLRETVDRTRRGLEAQHVRDLLPRLEPNKFERLGLSVLASDEEIERRFEEFSRQYLSKAGSNGYDEEFEQIRTTYQELRQDRQGYEQWLWREAESTLAALQKIAEMR